MATLGPPSVLQPRTDEPPIAWPDHPLAASSGEILARCILPLVGHNARDFARAAAVCRGWRAACRAAKLTLSVYREWTMTMEDSFDSDFMWSPCGKFVAAVSHYPPRLFVWRASTGELRNSWSIEAPPTPVPEFPGFDNGEEHYFEIAFSRDGTRVLTCFNWGTQFAVWNVDDGRLLAINRGGNGGPPGNGYVAIDFGVPGSASGGLIALAATTVTGVIVDLWSVALPDDGDAPTAPVQRDRVEVIIYAEGGDDIDEGSNPPRTLVFSPDGSKFAFAFCEHAFVYDVASIVRLGSFTTPTTPSFSTTAWTPDGRRVIVAWADNLNVCIWDFNAPEPPVTIAADLGPNVRVLQWSTTACYTSRRVGDDTLVEKRRFSGVSSRVLRSTIVSSSLNALSITVSPDGRAVIVQPLRFGVHESARIAVLN